MSTAGIRILCVEDDGEVCQLLCELLRDEGYQVDGAGNGQDALEALRKHAYQLLITDYHLPDFTGGELLKRARRDALLERTTTVMVTADRQQVQANGCHVFIKPLAIDDFLTRIHGILAPHRLAEMDRSVSGLAKSRRLASQDPPAARAPKIELVLYVSSGSPLSLKALKNIERVLADYEPADVQFRVVDLARESSATAEEDRIAFTPTLVKRSPEPRAWILGDLNDTSVLTTLLSMSGAQSRR